MHNPLAVEEWPFAGEHGRIPLVDRARKRRQGTAARDRRGARGDVPLVLAGPIHPGEEEFFEREVEPQSTTTRPLRG